METLYERADIYDLLEKDPARYAFTKKHWETILKGKQVQSLFDVSIGSGNMTLPLLELGVELHGSDLSEPMLDRCREKAAARGAALDLHVCDFRSLTQVIAGQFDCVSSTGNSLPYVTNREVLGVLEEMDKLVRPGGYLYFDLRNWDLILQTRQRFYLYNPVFDGDIRINLVQAWDYLDDGTMDFNLLYTFEKENKILQKEVFQEHYYPISQTLLLDKLRQLGYREPEIYRFPAFAGAYDPDVHDWYSVIARKPER